MAFVSCESVGQALILWAANAAPADLDNLCSTLDCGAGELTDVLAAIASDPAGVRNVLGLGTAALEAAGVANGVAELDASGHVPASQLPGLAITDVFVVNSQAAMLALTAQTGDVAVRLDENKTYILSASPASNPANWVQVLAPGGGGGAVTSVNGQTGIVVLTAADVGLGNVNNTSDINKPVSTMQQIALNGKVDKVPGKGLSTEDYTTAEKAKLAAVTDGLRGINNQTGTAYTPATGDNGWGVRITNSGAITVTVPTNASQPFPVGAVVYLAQGGTGGITPVAAGGVTLNDPNSVVTTAKGEWIGLVKVATNEWDVV